MEIAVAKGKFGGFGPAEVELKIEFLDDSRAGVDLPRACFA
jgi:hypothetical protein